MTIFFYWRIKRLQLALLKTGRGILFFIYKPSLGMELKRIPGEIFGFNLNYQAEDEHFVDLGYTQDVVNHSVSGKLNFGGTGGKSDLTLGGSY